MSDTPSARRLSQPELFRPPLTYPSMPFGDRLTRAVHLYPENEAIVFKDLSPGPDPGGPVRGGRRRAWAS